MEQSVSEYMIGTLPGRDGSDMLGMEEEQHSVRNMGINPAWLTHVLHCSSVRVNTAEDAQSLSVVLGRTD